MTEKHLTKTGNSEQRLVYITKYITAYTAELKISSLDLRCVILPRLPTKFSMTLTGVEGTQTRQMLRVRWGGGWGGGSYWQANVQREVHWKAPSLRWSPRRPLSTDGISSAGGGGEGGRSHGVGARMSCSCRDWPPPRGYRFTTAGEKPSPHPLPQSSWAPVQGSERLQKHLLSFPLGTLSHLTSWISDKFVMSCVSLKNAWSPSCNHTTASLSSPVFAQLEDVASVEADVWPSWHECGSLGTVLIYTLMHQWWEGTSLCGGTV